MTYSSGILDNKSPGNVVSELKGNIAAGCTLSVVSALFSLYAYDELKKELSKISKFRLLVPGHGDEESFLKNLTGSHLDRRLRNRLDVTRIARECSEWLKQKCEVRELPLPVNQNLIHVSHAGSNKHLAINAWMDRFTGYECSLFSRTFTIGKAVDRLERLTRCREIESRISELRGQLKKAAFDRQAELNTEIKKSEQELRQLAGKL